MTDEQAPPPERHETVRVRRSPRIWNFVLAGVIVGAVVALILTFAFPIEGEFTAPQIFGFLFLFIGVVFGALGAVVALVVDRRSRRRAREIEVDRETVIGTDPDE
ncbi:hypothetical protein [Herbiconiux sp. L3-i23]|uniref:hypothetical protein n=1 Tax=Herbiconiux sp. L3-i23 TaxID=2905871 RepID=UPI002050C18A|nr:hypothetical protein [Herbiconiux sp. L3-i23]BDI24065.1 hypothetical protein L3i23_28410 [Herbiconiux sp. L3-i23]